MTYLKLGLVGNPGSYVLAPITDDRSTLLKGLQALEFMTRPGSGDVFIFDAIRVASDDLIGRRKAQVEMTPDQAILLLAWETQGGTERQNASEAQKAKDAGIDVYLVSLPCCAMDQLASTRAKWFPYEVPELERATQDALAAIEASVVPRRMVSLVVTDTLPANMEYVPDSASPAADWDASRRQLTWQFHEPVPEALTMTLRVRPQVCGIWPTNVAAGAEAVDWSGQHYYMTYPVPEVEVICPTPTPTPTATTASSATPTLTPSLRSTSTVAPTYRPPEPLYLPLALSEACVPEEEHADVALVIDASTSMLDEVRPGQTKLAATLAAAAQFVELLKAGDQGAIVWFNETAALEQALTPDHALLQGALGRIRTHSFTRLDLAIDVARTELESRRHIATNGRVIIALTDGKANPVGPETAVEAARRAKAAGILIFTVGLGQRADLDDDALRRIASRPEYYYYQTADTADLELIYETIAGAIPCPTERFWGRRTIRPATHASAEHFRR